MNKIDEVTTPFFLISLTLILSLGVILAYAHILYSFEKAALGLISIAVGFNHGLDKIIYKRHRKIKIDLHVSWRMLAERIASMRTCERDIVMCQKRSSPEIDFLWHVENL